MIVFYSKDAKFNLTEQEFQNFIKQAKGGKKVWIPRLQVFLSDMFIWAGNEPESQERKQLHDGSWAVRKFGVWVDEKNTETKIDLNYYRELNEEKNLKKLSIEEENKKITS
jgi:hypothetical protein